MGDAIDDKEMGNGRNVVTRIRYRHNFVDGIDVCDDVIFHILTRVPARILHSRMRYVSKKWLRMISDPVFVDAHLNALTRSGSMLINNGWSSQQKILTITGSDCRVQSQFATDDGVRVLGSCNGLLLLLGLNTKDNDQHIDGRVAIFNPATGCLWNLTPLPLHSGSTIMPNGERGGIGFDPVTKQYKVAIFFRYLDKSGWNYNFNVLTVGHGSHYWRSVHGLPHSMRYYSHPSVLINSSRLNWFVSAKDPYIATLDTTLIWDGSDDIFRRIEFNDIFGRIEFNEEMKKDHCFGPLMEMRGCLAISQLSRKNGIVIRAIAEDNIWTKRIVIADQPFLWPIIGIIQTSWSSACDEGVLIVEKYMRTFRGIPYSTKDAVRVTVNHLTDIIYNDNDGDNDDGYVGRRYAYAHVDSLVSLSATNYRRTNFLA